MVVAVSASGVRWIEALIALLELRYDGFKDIASRASLERTLLFATVYNAPVCCWIEQYCFSEELVIAPGYFP